MIVSKPIYCCVRASRRLQKGKTKTTNLSIGIDLNRLADAATHNDRSRGTSRSNLCQEIHQYSQFYFVLCFDRRYAYSRNETKSSCSGRSKQRAPSLARRRTRTDAVISNRIAAKVSFFFTTCGLSDPFQYDSVSLRIFFGL